MSGECMKLAAKFMSGLINLNSLLVIIGEG